MAIRRSLHSDEYKTFLRILKSVREDAGVTQVELATRLKQTQTFISKCERGQRRIDVIEMRQICKALKLDFGSFIKKLDAALKPSRR
jgi:transcriptional regulator with XRE-family HTH domain